MKKYYRTSVVITKEHQDKLKFLTQNGINISYEVRNLIATLYDKKIKKNEK